MKCLNNISDYKRKYSHKFPKAWKSGDIVPNSYLPQLNELLELMRSKELDKSMTINLRYQNRFKSLYLELHRELEEGTGVVFFPGTLFKKFEYDERRRLFFNLGQFIGQVVPINLKGELIREVKNSNLKNSVMNPVRGHLTNEALAFHSDRADITMLLCESVAAFGGEFQICSSANLFLKLQEHPDILKVLQTDILHDMRNEGCNGQLYCAHPIIHYKESFVVRYIRKFIESMVRHDISVNRNIYEAIDCIDEIIYSRDFYQQIVFNPGDLILFNNHLTLHARNNFIDDENNRRCLLRLWLGSEFSRELPKSFTPIFHSTKAGTPRGGILI